MKMQRVKDLATGAIISALVVGITPVALAKTGTANIPVQYSNIKVVVDGKDLSTSKEPFIYDGTTYLPLRAVAEAVGKEVSWDNTAKVAYLGKAPEKVKQEKNSGKNEDIKFTGADLDYEIGLPTLYLEYTNQTDSEIIRFDIYVNCYDAYGKYLNTFGNKYYMIDKIKGHEESHGELTLMESGVQKVTWGLYKYQTKDGKTVEIPEDKIKWWNKEY